MYLFTLRISIHNASGQENHDNIAVPTLSTWSDAAPLAGERKMGRKEENMGGEERRGE